MSAIPTDQVELSHQGLLTRFGQMLFGFPLFYKILVANIAIVLTCTLVGTLFTISLVRAEPDRSLSTPITIFALLGVLSSAIVNAVILRLALSPLKALEQTADRVQQGDLAARAPLSPLADAELQQLVNMFNSMLDHLEVYRQRLKDTAHRAIHAEEMERKRLSHELHDETSQRLAALIIRLRLVRDAKDDALRNARIERLRTEIVEITDDIRRFARGLRPTVLDQVGLTAAITAQARHIQENSQIDIIIDADQLEGLLTPDTELALYRIVQEAMSNSVRHAKAQSICVRIANSDGCVIASVTDDGCGFVEDDLASTGATGLGLFGMRERASYVQGDVSIDSTPERGTSVQVRIPIEATDD